MTHYIDIEICDTEKEALLLENKLIRQHQPEFNHAKKQPETYYFIALQWLDEKLEFSLQMHQPDKDYIFGAFKGHRIVRKTMGGIIRILYILDHQVETVFQIPSVLTQKLTPMKFSLSTAKDGELMKRFWPLIIDFFEGRNKRLINHIMEICKEHELLESFAGSMILDDLEAMKWFYERCSHRNYQIYRQLDLDSLLIPQDRLDDLLIEWVFLNSDE